MPTHAAGLASCRNPWCILSRMTQQQIFRLSQLSVIDVSGADAATIVHNVTTNEVRSLSHGQGNECFITDVRGKTLGHMGVYRTDNSLRLIGAGGQSQQVADHLERYTIREDATPTIRDLEYAGFALSPGLAAALVPDWTAANLLPCVQSPYAKDSDDLYGCRWLGEGSAVLLVKVDDQERVLQEACERLGATVGEEVSFHAARTEARFPWFGIDLNETNLPQEAARDAVAISFTKGCYLGQETVARLDALGQVQKKLVAWSIEGGVPDPGTPLTSGEKTVGRLTSVGDKGNKVHQILANYQTGVDGASAKGGGGWLRIMKFLPAENKILVETYSPFLKEWKNDVQNKFELEYPMGKKATED